MDFIPTIVGATHWGAVTGFPRHHRVDEGYKGQSKLRGRGYIESSMANTVDRDLRQMLNFRVCNSQ